MRVKHCQETSDKWVKIRLSGGKGRRRGYFNTLPSINILYIYEHQAKRSEGRLYSTNFFLPDCHVHTKEPISTVARTLLHFYLTFPPGNRTSVF